MIRKTTIRIILSAFLLSTVIPAFGQYSTGQVTIRQTAFYRQGDQVTVDMDVMLGNAQVAKRAYVLLRPVLANDTLDARMELPAIMINGKNRAKAYRRLVALHREPIHVGNVINASDKNTPRSFHYSVTVPYEEWMKRANIRIDEEQCECNGPLVPMNFQLLAVSMEDRNPRPAPQELIYTYNLLASFVEPKPEAVKNRSETGRAYLDFSRGQSVIKPDFGNNAAELDKIGSLIRTVKNDPNTTITNIIIDGYASPEGTYASNMTLSGRRAIALKDYLKNNYGLSERLFRVTGRGEDWNTLEDMVSDSQMAHKQQILDIIHSTEIFDGREKKLMDLAGGAPYRDMLENLFPKLRRSDYELKYTVIPFTVTKGKEVIQSNPSQLSLNEFFLIAETYRTGSAEFNEVFSTAAKVYPDSDIANVNAAAAAIALGNADAALAYLGKVSNPNAAALNNLGIAWTLKGDYAKATDYFRQATAAGNEHAAKNLEQINKRERQD